MVIGVAGSLPIHGIGTATFLIVDSNGCERLLKIHNCLLCQSTTAGESFNLISVSQMLKTGLSTVEFNKCQSKMTMQSGKRQQLAVFDLQPDDGLYALDMFPLNAADRRHKTLVSIDMTVNEHLHNGTNVGGEIGHLVLQDPVDRKDSLISGKNRGIRRWVGRFLQPLRITTINTTCKEIVSTQ